MNTSTSTSPSGSSKPRVVIVIGAYPKDAELVAKSFASQGDEMRVVWFKHAREALAAGLENTLAGIVVCQKDDSVPSDDLITLRRALPDTPILPWEHHNAA